MVQLVTPSPKSKAFHISTDRLVPLTASLVSSLKPLPWHVETRSTATPAGIIVRNLQDIMSLRMSQYQQAVMPELVYTYQVYH